MDRLVTLVVVRSDGTPLGALPSLTILCLLDVADYDPDTAQRASEERL
jgi:hypothetical protein